MVFCIFIPIFGIPYYLFRGFGFKCGGLKVLWFFLFITISIQTKIAKGRGLIKHSLDVEISIREEAYNHIELNILPDSSYLVLHQKSRQFLTWAKASFDLLK